MPNQIIEPAINYDADEDEILSNVISPLLSKGNSVSEEQRLAIEAMVNNLVAGTPPSVTDNMDNTYTFNDGNGNTTIIQGRGNPPTLVDNGDGSYTFDDGAGNTLSFDGGTTPSIVNNGDSTYTFDDGVGNTIDIQGGVESTITDNFDGSYTYDNGLGAVSNLNPKLTTIHPTWNNTVGDEMTAAQIADMEAFIDQKINDKINIVNPAFEPTRVVPIFHPGAFPILEADQVVLDSSRTIPGADADAGGTINDMEFIENDSKIVVLYNSASLVIYNYPAFTEAKRIDNVHPLNNLSHRYRMEATPDGQRILVYRLDDSRLPKFHYEKNASGNYDLIEYTNMLAEDHRDIDYFRLNACGNCIMGINPANGTLAFYWILSPHQVGAEWSGRKLLSISTGGSVKAVDIQFRRDNQAIFVLYHTGLIREMAITYNGQGVITIGDDLAEGQIPSPLRVSKDFNESQMTISACGHKMFISRIRESHGDDGLVVMNRTADAWEFVHRVEQPVGSTLTVNWCRDYAVNDAGTVLLGWTCFDDFNGLHDKLDLS